VPKITLSTNSNSSESIHQNEMIHLKDSNIQRFQCNRCVSQKFDPPTEFVTKLKAKIHLKVSNHARLAEATSI